MQMLKFGRLVDLERLENVTVNRTAEELKEKLRQQELQNANDLAKWEVSASHVYFKPREIWTEVRTSRIVCLVCENSFVENLPRDAVNN